ncbi:2-dehydropantoate 2-reductase [Pseudotabrizicola sediminis]|uniref:2-dehydropantoate 2-reductase n=1 Tax=Pseudotabrizicola sediminis TaxID=2486418 RepID=A0ABY2KHH0_9RHOB|nr:2-dehydropantoate 2-reductase [Pseudotabrizicola sediminis]TGD41740.1 2-dehydropantoate 2-reductase [Pseudotabrizicola sediminis]
MRVAILGAGATGGCLAISLAEAGCDVTLLARGAHFDAIRQSGLRLIDAEGGEITRQMKAVDDPADLGPQDLLISTLKAPALPLVLGKVPETLRRNVPLLTAMNGVFWWYGHGFQPQSRALDTSRLDPAGQMSLLTDPGAAMGAVIYSTNEVVAAGVVRNRSKTNRLVIGSSQPDRTDHVAALFQRLSSPRFEFEVVADIRRRMWHKLLRNLSSAPISVLTAARVREINDDPQVLGLARALFLEGAQVAAAHGFSGLSADVEDVVSPGVGALQRPSMRQDLDLRRPMEIDSILRIVQDFGRQSDVYVPVLDMIVPLVILRARTAGCYPPAV